MRTLNIYLACFMCAALLTAALVISTAAPAEARDRKSSGQVVYVPAYSHIYSGDKERPVALAVTLSIRNTSITDPITVTEVEYLDSDGKLVKNFLEKPVVVKPFSSIRYVIKESDKAGGSGAKFLVVWKSAMPVQYPIIETIMISTAGQQGISFTSRGQVIDMP